MSNITTTAAPVDPSICEKGGHGLLLPLGYGTGNAAEWEWSPGVRGFLYTIFLAWLFQGVAIIADVFMNAIEEITAKRKTVVVDGKDFHVKTWNDTVANLTLMALGSSAPEILLSVVEIMGAGFYSGDLGPSTIVGSAAFNLLVITAVCIIAIDPSEIRKINDMNVFTITAIFSVFAYVWLLIVLTAITPNIVNISEGIITALFFPILVWLAYLADKGYFSAEGEHVDGIGLGGTSSKFIQMDSGGYSKDDIAKVLKEVRDEYGSSVSLEQANKLAIFRLMGQRKKSRAEYRIEATRMLTGGKGVGVVKLDGIEDEKIIAKEMARMRSKGVKVAKGASVLPSQDLEAGKKEQQSIADDNATKALADGKSVVSFSAAMHGFLESAGTIKVSVHREGNLDQPISVKYDTRDGTASAGDDYLASSGVLEFASGEVTKDVQVTLIDDNQWEPDETFDIVLSDPEKQPDGSKGIFITEPAVSTITIINDDEPGVLEFAEHRYQVAESEGELVVTVKRKNGSDGTVTCKYSTQDHSDKSAVEGVDYEASEGTLVFDNAEIEKTFKIPIINSGKYQRDERFQLRLSEATGGATFSADTDGSIESETCVVTIVHDVGTAKTVDHISQALNINVDRLKLGSANWYEQFTDALQVNGGEESDEPPSTADWIAHITSLPWKLFFATCPPTDFAGGWACFVVSLAMIGGVTVIIGDAAAIFGCLFGLKDSVTAITFVALGTSLPDTFASMTAAKQDPYADASIGNITGSNSVNVFLGLGLPWVIATLYWASTNGGKPTAEWTAKYSKLNIYSEAELSMGGFAVPAGSLGFSVAVFCCCATTCFAILNFRRRTVGGELGGPKRLQNISAIALVSLWFIYVLLSSLKAYEVI